MGARVYLDWNAAAPIRPEAKKAMVSVFDKVGNPSSIHAEGRTARAIIETARTQVAEAFCVDAERIVFTSGATEAAALSLADKKLISAPVEHDSVLAWTNPVLAVNKDGMVTVENPEISTLQVANGETGVVQELPVGIKVSDASQAFGKIPIAAEIKRAGIVFASAHKIGGPKGVGAVILGPGEELRPHLKGGGQELGRRSGTENVVGIAGFGAAAIAAANEIADGTWNEVEILRDNLEAMICDVASDIVFIGTNSKRLPNTTCFAAPGWKAETQVIQMDLNGFSISAGSACSSGKVKESGVLSALGVSPSLAESAVRVSIGPTTTESELWRFASTWAEQRLQFVLRQAKNDKAA